ncbi:MAG: phospholipase D-like domain-containing protein [Salinivirgaceae bacterium]
MRTKIITNEQHYDEVIKRVRTAKSFIWIGTADIKDLHVSQEGRAVSFLHTLNQLAQKKVQLRLIYAKTPGENFKSSLAKYPLLQKSMETMLCPRVHFKHIIIDRTFAYTGSANLTGAGLGMKSPNRRNFEAGIITTEPVLIEQIMDQFDEVWMGKFCPSCGRKAYCETPLG